MDRGAWQAVGYESQTGLSAHTRTCPVNQPKLPSPALPAVWLYSWAWGESPQNKAFWLFLKCFELRDHKPCALLLWPLPRAQHMGAACMEVVLGAWATA